MEFVIGIGILVIAIVMLMVASYVKAPRIQHTLSPASGNLAS